jgi:hypothetical protein
MNLAQNVSDYTNYALKLTQLVLQPTCSKESVLSALDPGLKALTREHKRSPSNLLFAHIIASLFHLAS